MRIQLLGKESYNLVSLHFLYILFRIGIISSYRKRGERVLKLIKNHLVLLLIFALILSGTFISNVNSKTVQAATSDDLPSEV